MQSDVPERSLAKLARRGAIAAFGVFAGVVLAWPGLLRQLVPRPEIEVFDVGARARQIASGVPNAESATDPYYFLGRGGSAHLHVLGARSICPLHLHENTEEATVLVMNEALITQRFGGGPSIVETSGERTEGTVLMSPAECAHSWANPSFERAHASLVFTLGAPFSGNVYVGPDDPRILSAGSPSSFDALAELSSFRSGGDASREVRLSPKLGSLTALFVRTRAVVEAQGHSSRLIYVVAGKGRLEGLGEPIPLLPTVLVVQAVDRRGEVVADASDPLAALVVRPAE